MSFSHFRIIPPKVSVSEIIGTFERQVGNKAIQKLSTIKKETILANHFWSHSYFVNTVSLMKILFDVIFNNKRSKTKKKRTIVKTFLCLTNLTTFQRPFEGEACILFQVLLSLE
ncbi:transposase [Proteiniphilum sp. X52]|uniref:transposase n=1 Tax=Proteiniphilum sp. X52 TaxID=2382159 RepID=UPI000F0A8098|nr:hypothetical protein D7D25_02375 [Proteiniphilum sp. X52]